MTEKSPPEVAVGQKWRNKRSGKVVQIADLTVFGSLASLVTDVHWRSIMRGGGGGHIWSSNFYRNYEFVQKASTPSSQLPGGQNDGN